MPIELTCSHCSRLLRIAEDTAGKRIRCPQCQFILDVPNGSAQPPLQIRDLWYVKTQDGKNFGPVAKQELDQWVVEGRLSRSCQLLLDGDKQWRWAGSVYPHLGQPQNPKTAPPHANNGSHATNNAAASYASVRVNPLPGGGAVSGRSRLVAGLLGLLLPFFTGLCGIHRLYLGHIGIGLLMLFTFGGCFIWQFIDVILVFSGSVTDADGLPLRD